ncbi:MAG TPA: hypothetical protein VFA37_00340 [Gaiellaceae bacterium]|nr:hypothetical protein [Gaiellaceae bacterium]
MRIVAPLAVALALAVPAAALSAVRGAPKPCTLISKANASKLLKAPAKAYPARAHDGGTICLWIASTGRLQIDDGPSSLSSTPSAADSPPGTVIKKEPVLGPAGWWVYNTSKKYRFANAGFVLGAYEYDVYSQVVAPQSVFALAKLIHHKLGG